HVRLAPPLALPPAGPPGTRPLSLHDALPISLFDGALDLDLAVQGRGWATFRGRALHAPTGLFALPAPSAAEVPASGTVDVLVRRDRKSTRLNSSHVKISYAVFCLKKKKAVTV